MAGDWQEAEVGGFSEVGDDLPFFFLKWGGAGYTDVLSLCNLLGCIFDLDIHVHVTPLYLSVSIPSLHFTF